MTPILLAFGIYCNVALVIYIGVADGKGNSVERANYLDSAFMLHFAGFVYFWVKVSDLWLGWSA